MADDLTSLVFVRHARARRYVIRVRPDGSVRVTLPRTAAPDYGKDPGFLFDGVYYLLSNPELVPAQTLSSAWQHWVSTGAAGESAGRSAKVTATFRVIRPNICSNCRTPDSLVYLPII